VTATSSATPCDNCPTLPNDDQADADHDGRGDVCDDCIQLVPAVGDEAPRIGNVNDGLSTSVPYNSPYPLPVPNGFGQWGVARSRELATAGTVYGNLNLLSVGEGNRLSGIILNGSYYDGTEGTMQAAMPNKLAQQIVFTADYPVRPGMSAVNGFPQLFITNAAASVVRQLTNGGSSSIAINPSIDGAGTVVAYASNGDPVGLNADGGMEVFLQNLTTGVVTQITRGASCNNGTDDGGRIQGPVLSEDGNRVGFLSTCVTPVGGAPGLTSAWVYDRPTNTFTQMQHCPGCTHADLPWLSRDGKTAINYDIDFTTDRMWLMVHRINGTAVTSRRVCPWVELDRLTFAELLLFFTTFNRPNVSETGKRIVYTTNTDLTGANPSRFLEVFVMDPSPDLTTAKVRQVTDGTDLILSAGVALDWKGSRLWTYGSYPGLSQIPNQFELLRVNMPEP
jgi:hypothetical protein